MKPLSTQQEFEQVIHNCRELFCKKLHDYGTAWRVMRPETMTDQLLIKASRIRSLQMKGCSKVGEGIIPEFIGIVNYCIIALIQLEKVFLTLKIFRQKKLLNSMIFMLIHHLS